jgi:hypothetical protein
MPGDETRKGPKKSKGVNPFLPAMVYQLPWTLNRGLAALLSRQSKRVESSFILHIQESFL